MNKPHWEHFEHQADIGVRGYGETLEQALEQAANALINVITDINSVEARDCIQVTCSAEENDLLLLDWLNELVFQIATRRMLFSSFRINLEEHKLTATICGEAVSQKKHKPAVEVKGATFTELKVVQDETGQWMAQCVVDV